MKKLFFLMSFALLAFASCSNDEVETKAVQKSADAVNFLPAMNNATRGAIYTDAGFSSDPGEFAVIASGSFKTGDKDNYTGATATNSYSATVKYESGAWNLPSANYLWWGDGTTAGKFTAYAPKDAGSVSSGTLSFAVEAAIKDQKDLVVAYNEGSRSDFTSGVPLHFRHALSQIIVNASYADEADETTYPKDNFPSLKVKVKAIRFRNLSNGGTLTLPTASTASGETYTPAWTPSTALTSYTSTENEVELGSAPQTLLKSDDGAMLLLPQTQSPAASLASVPSTGAYLEILADIDYASIYTPTAGNKYFDYYPEVQENLTSDQTAGEGKYDWIAVPVTISWDGGYKYTYTLNFSNIACGKVSPNKYSDVTNRTKTNGDDVISGVPYPVNFLVTVEDTWQDGGTTTPAL